MGQAVAFGEEVWAGHGEHRFMQARRHIRRLVDTFGARGSGRHGGLPLRRVVPRRIGGTFDRGGGVFRYSCFTLQRYEKKLKLPNYKRKNYQKLHFWFYLIRYQAVTNDNFKNTVYKGVSRHFEDYRTGRILVQMADGS